MKRVLVEKNRYFDSVFLMRISREIEGLESVAQAIVSMATPANADNLRGAGFELTEAVTPQDLLVAIDAADDVALDEANAHLQALLSGSTDDQPGEAARPASLQEAVNFDPEANLALISVPGEYAAREARQALRRGLHVMLFSDNVTVEDEVALKTEAVERGLLMMGPDCGTAILNGVPLGFANTCRQGATGIVGASGTGIQEISTLVHQFGGGISQAIGTGGRDLSADVGALMTRFGIEALAADDATGVVVVVSKTPAPEVAQAVVATLKKAGKPGVVHFVGATEQEPDGSVRFAGTLADAAVLACEAAGLEVSLPGAITRTDHASGSIFGLFCGGTLCQEAWSLLDRAGLNVVSNVASDKAKKVHPEMQVQGHALWDLGDDVFTVGRPHPMIEPELRDERVALAGEDSSIGIVLVDCVIGYGAHEDPAGSLAKAAEAALRRAADSNRTLQIIASVTGTDLDPQNASAQREILEQAGVLVAPSNAAAVALVLQLLERGSS